MKKIILLISVIIFGFGAMAQDVILKQDGTEIQAKVIEITDQHVKYKNFNFQDGPTRNVNISEVFMITYENGEKEVFNKQTSTPTNNISLRNLKAEFDSIGTNDAEMLKFFGRNNLTKHYDGFESACRSKSTGTGLLCGGILANVAAFGCLLDKQNRVILKIVGGVLLTSGQILIIASIPVSISAGVRKRVIKNDFSKTYFGIDEYTYQPKLNFGITQNGGIGFALNF